MLWLVVLIERKIKVSKIEFRSTAEKVVSRLLTRFRRNDWPYVLALVKERAPLDLRRYVNQWVQGSSLDRRYVLEAERRLLSFRMAHGGERTSSNKRSRSL